jgi:RNA polymerase sigma factor (sigma-70 family)
MARSPLSDLLGCLRALARDSAATDGQLLEQFTSQKDEQAFDTLMQRYGPLVWGVCRRVLRDEHDAEDAFQATFLVLVRKARSVSKRDSVRSWLHGVALRTALRAKERQTSRQARERQAPPRQGDDPLANVVWDDLRPVLDEEVNRLPEKYRVPVILCYLQGLTNEQAARHLGCSRDTVATRLARARRRLYQRLTRRGLALSLGMLATLLSPSAASAVMPIGLTRATVRAAMLVVAGKAATAGTVSAPVVALTEGVIRSMFLSQVKTIGAVLVAMAAVATGAGVATYRGQAEQPAAKNEAPRPELAEHSKMGADLIGRFKYRVPYEIGQTYFKEGGRIDILEVWGTQPKIVIGGQYLVRGKYVIPPGSEGILYFFRTSTGSDGSGPIMDLQRTDVMKGQGEFTLFHGMGGPGYFHLILTAAERYSRTFADVYFGTGDTVYFGAGGPGKRSTPPAPAVGRGPEQPLERRVQQLELELRTLQGTVSELQKELRGKAPNR